MSFGEFYGAFSQLGGNFLAQQEADKQERYQREAADLAGKQLDYQLGLQGAQPQIGLGMLGQAPGGGASPGPLAALGATAPKVPSFSGGAQAMSLPAPTEVENKFVGALKEGGLTNPFGLAAAAAYAKRESGYSPSKVTGAWSDPSESGQAGTSGGILSWRADRLDNMRAFTAGAKDPVTAQAKFFLTEDPNTTLALQNARSPEEANDILAKAWKFAGYNRPGGGEYAARLGTTRAYVDRLASLGTAAPAQIATATPNGQLPPGASGLNPAFRPPAVARAMPQQPTQVASADPSFAPAPSMVGQPAPAEIGVGSNILNAPMQPNGAAPMAVPPARPPQTLIPQSMAGAGIPGTVMNRGIPAAQVGPASAPPQQVASAQAGDGEADLPAPNAQAAGFQIPPGGAQQNLPQQSVTAPDFVPGTVAAPAIQNGRAQDLPAVQGAPRLSPQQAQFLRAQLANPLTRPQAIQAIQGLNAPEKWETKELGGRVVQVNGRGDVRALPGFDKPEELTQFKAADGNDYLLNKRTGQATRLIQGKEEGYTTLITPEQRAQYGVDPAYKGVVQVGPGQQLHFPGKASTEVNVNQTAEKAQDAKIGGAYGDTFNDLQSGARGAQGQINTLRLMEKLVDNPNFYSGPQSGAFLAAKRAASAIGIKGAEDAAAPNELFAKLATQSLLDKAGGSLGAGISNFDVMTLNRTIANPENTPEGNRQIIQFGKALAQRQIDVARLARQYAGAHGGRLDPGFDDQLQAWSEAHPLGLEMTALQKQQQAATEAQAAQRGSAPPRGILPGAGSSSAQAQEAPAPSPYREGQTATNPKTGAKAVFQGGRWVPAQQAPAPSQAGGIL